MIGREGARCECPPGYSGAQCEVDPCATRPCKNGGECSIGAERNVKCACTRGYWGEYCENTNSTCRNGLHCYHEGVCIDRGFHGRDSFCACKPNYFGIVCHIFDPPDETPLESAITTAQSLEMPGAAGVHVAQLGGDPLAQFAWAEMSSESGGTTERRSQVTTLLLVMLAIIAVLVLSLVCLAFVLVIIRRQKSRASDQQYLRVPPSVLNNNSQLQLMYNNLNGAASVDERARSPSVETGSTNGRGALSGSLSTIGDLLRDVKGQSSSHEPKASQESLYKMKPGKSLTSLSSSVKGANKPPSVHTHDSILKRDSFDTEMFDRVQSQNPRGALLPPSTSAYCFSSPGHVFLTTGDVQPDGDASFPVVLLQGTDQPSFAGHRRHLQTSKSFHSFTSRDRQLSNASRSRSSHQSRPMSPLAVEAPLPPTACSPASRQTFQEAATGVPGQFHQYRHLCQLPGFSNAATQNPVQPPIPLSTFDTSRHARSSAFQQAPTTRNALASIASRHKDCPRGPATNSASRESASPPAYEQCVAALKSPMLAAESTDPNETKYRNMQRLTRAFSPSSASSDCDSACEQHEYSNVIVGPPLPPKRATAVSPVTGTESVCSQCDLHEIQAGYFSESEEAGAAREQQLLVAGMGPAKKLPTTLDLEHV